MINLTDGKKMIVKMFKSEFGGMNMSEATALEFLNRVAKTAYNGRSITSEQQILAAYNAQKADFLGV